MNDNKVTGTDEELLNDDFLWNTKTSNKMNLLINLLYYNLSKRKFIILSFKMPLFKIFPSTSTYVFSPFCHQVLEVSLPQS